MRATGEGKGGREGKEKGLTSLELLSFSNSLLTFTKYSKNKTKESMYCTCNRIKLPQLNYLPMALP